MKIKQFENKGRVENPLISVVVPVYSVELYLGRCINSIVNQSYKNIEIVLVDDGSPDRCGQICDEWAIKDSRIKVVHKSNGGLSSARNAGIEVASGDYIAFVDSDDWIAPDTYEYAISMIEKHQAHAMQFDVKLTTDEKAMPDETQEEIKVLKDKEILEYYLDSSTRRSGGYSVCRCVFDAPVAKCYRFRDGKINEDIDWKYKVLRDCQSWVVSNQQKYFYWQGGESTSVGGLKRRDFQLREAADLLAELTSNETYGNIAFLGKVKKARTAFSLLSRIAYFGVTDSSIDKKEIVKELTKEHRENVRTLLKAPLPLSRKVLAVMFAVSFPITEAAIHLAKKL